ncbi:hypothetical protein BX616_008800, partial [Lobosporangium transversale]
TEVWGLRHGQRYSSAKPAIAGNDYSRNLKTLDLINNLRLVRKVAWNKNYNKMLRDYLREASKVLGRNAASKEGRFRVAPRFYFWPSNVGPSIAIEQ